MHFGRSEQIRTEYYPSPFIIEIAQVIVRKADQPGLLFDLADSHQLPGKRGAGVDLALADLGMS